MQKDSQNKNTLSDCNLPLQMHVQNHERVQTFWFYHFRRKLKESPGPASWPASWLCNEYDFRILQPSHAICLLQIIVFLICYTFDFFIRERALNVTS